VNAPPFRLEGSRARLNVGARVSPARLRPWGGCVDIGPPQRIIEIEPLSLPLPEALPEPERIPDAEPVEPG
jgi:hypothetical protein